MNFYNMLHGATPSVFIILPMLGKHPDEYPRFRDCFLADEEHPEYDNHIHVYTRTGGGNRQDHKKDHKEMMEHPNYVVNFDDNFDCTYATFVFSVPDKWKEDFEKIKNGKLQEISEGYKKEIYRVYPKLKDQFDNLFDVTKGQSDE